ncbi:MAG: ion transporter [Brevinema sp.]
MAPKKRRLWLEEAELKFYRVKQHQVRFEGYFAQFIAIMVYLSIGTIILETDRALNIQYASLFNYMNFIIYIVFTLEYIYKHFIGTQKFRYVFSLGSLLDIVALIPFFLHIFEVSLPFNTHLLRLVWILKIFRVPQFQRTSLILKKVFQKERETLWLTLSLCFALILVSSVLMWTIENPAQPEHFTSIIATMWWSVSTLTTVGYGDMYPITPIGKMLAAVTAIIGIGIFVIPTGVISAGFMSEYQLDRNKDQSKKTKEENLNE